MIGVDEHDVMKRAIKAYHRANPEADIPSRSGSTVDEDGGRVVVTLRNVRGTLARYRYDPNRDRLFRLVPVTAD